MPIKLIVFQPKEDFYSWDFEKRFANLEDSIRQAKEYLVKHFAKDDQKALFVAPEYLFKDFSQEHEKRYFSHAEKKSYVEKLKVLSKAHEEIIIAPGTICWQKPAKKDGNTYFRNTAYFFYNGNKVGQYKKNYPDRIMDYDFQKSNIHDMDFFRRGDTRGSIIEIEGLTIGVEICLDNLQSVLIDSSKKEPKKKIDIHLIMADGVFDNKLSSLKIEGLVYAKVERIPRDKFSTKIGTIQYLADWKIKDRKGDVISAELDCYNISSKIS